MVRRARERSGSDIPRDDGSGGPAATPGARVHQRLPGCWREGVDDYRRQAGNRQKHRPRVQSHRFRYDVQTVLGTYPTVFYPTLHAT